MKFLTFFHKGHDRLGALVENTVIDLASADPTNSDLTSMQALIEGGDDAMQAAHRAAKNSSVRLDPRDITWRAPLPRPLQMRDCLCFEQHLINSFESALKIQAMQSDDPAAAEQELRASGRFNVPDIWYRQPIYYKANRFSVAATNEDVIWPSYSNIMDFELEIACIIGKKGCDIKVEDAGSHIFGYTIFNDFSARDAQVAEQMGMLGPAKGKDFDKASILGPVIVTADEIPDPYNLAMRAKINDEILCDSNSSTMHWKFGDMIAHISQSETLYPGEVIGSGTVGWGCGLEHMRFLEHGDVVELEIEGIGTLSNRVLRSEQTTEKVASS